MSRNMGRQAHRTVQGAMHHQLDNDIADAKSLLNTSVQATKDLKVHLKGLIDKKKEAASGKACRNGQAGANKFNIPIPKIQGAATGMASSSVTVSTPLASVDSDTNKDSDIEMQDITPIDIRLGGSVWKSGPVRFFGPQGHRP
jgi:hypothetical protein